MRHIDQIGLVFPQVHIFPQHKKDNKSDGVLCFFVPFFFHHVSGSYWNEEETPVIKLLCKKRYKGTSTIKKKKKEVSLLLLQVWKACSFINANGVPSW
jgi:hypothetical protein